MGRQRTASPLRVLFIGNSFTARNDLPGLVARLAAARGHALEHHLISAGGASLRLHWNAGTAPQAIAADGYDVVVLQEQSTLPVKNPKRMFENVRLFGEAIKAAGAKTALYMTWARRHAPQTQQAITDAYNGIGQEIGAAVAPVGVAWQAFLRGHDQPALYDPDGSHPTPAGTYLAACVFLAVLFGASPVGVECGDVPGVAVGDRRRLEEAAWQATKSATKPTRTRSRRTTK